MYDVREYMGNYNKEQFYSIMGRFFAERIYRKKLPYLCNEREKIWYLFYKGKELVGFCAVKPLELHTLISDIFVLEPYKETNAFAFIAKYIVNNYKKNDLQVLTNLEEEKNVWIDLGFEVISNKGSYMICRKERLDERNKVSCS